MGTFASVTHLRIDGIPDESGYIFQDITRDGVGGKAFWLTGYHAGPFTLRTTTGFAAATGPALYANTWNQLRGQMLILVDDLGIEWDNLFVHRVRMIQHFKVLGASDGATNYIMVCDWDLEHIPTS